MGDDFSSLKEIRLIVANCHDCGKAYTNFTVFVDINNNIMLIQCSSCKKPVFSA